MPLPLNGGQWPPEDQRSIYHRMEEWQAWWSGDLDALRKVYGGGQKTRQSFTEKGGVVGMARRFWHGQPQQAGQRDTKGHVPLAADICQASADLLFSEPLTVDVADDKAQERLDEILADGFDSTISTAAEISAALGGTYLRIVWDETVAEHPFIDAVDADYATPEFKWSRLRAVTFYFIVETRNNVVWRHAERHEVDAFGIGVVYHGLYQGTVTELGSRVPLDKHPATEGITADADGMVSTLTPGLAAAYIPNILPNRRWRKHPVGRNLGRSDLDQLEWMLDALDEVYGSWMRDIRLGKARILAGRSALEDNGPGNGASFNLDREVFEGLNTAPGAVAKAGSLEIEQVQFDIRYQEHLETAKALTKLILRSAGYSASTFGEQESTGATTATEVQSRDARSLNTRNRKARHFQTSLQRLFGKLLDIDQQVFGGPGRGDLPVTVGFPEGSQESPMDVAQTVQALRSAESASTEVRVRMIHPEWTQQAVDDEVKAIMAEFSLADPAEVGTGGFSLTPPAPPEDTEEQDEIEGE